MITLAAGPLEAVFAPEAGMVCHSLRHDGEELLAQRDGVEGYARTGRTMGVPLLHPWANRLAAWDYEALGRRVDLAPLAGDVVARDGETGLPIHGVLPRAVGRASRPGRRGSPPSWRPRRAPPFPFPHRIRLDAELSPDALRIATTLEALEGEVPVAFGFHPWFDAAGRAARRRTRSSCRRCAGSRSTSASCRRARPSRRRAFAGPLGGARPRRRLRRASPTARCSRSRAAGAGSRCASSPAIPCAQVFAPPDKDLICFEPMTAPANALRSGRVRRRRARAALPRGVLDRGGLGLGASERMRRCSQTMR